MNFIVETDIPYGNACLVEVASMMKEGTDPALSTFTVAFAPHPHGGPEVLWFCFRVRRIAQIAQRTMTSGRIIPGPRKLRLVLMNPGNMLGGQKVENMRPVVRYEGRDWERLSAGTPSDLPDGRTAGIWTIHAPATYVDVAYCYPYGMPDVEQLVADSGGAVRADTIGASQAGRPILRVSNSPGEPGSERQGVYAISRQHSGETPGSWVLDGFLREVASMTKEGDDPPLVWAVPLSNVDGVEEGDYGKDNFPYDLNRAWGRPPMRHETLVIQRDMNLWKGRARPALALDFHAPGACETKGVYAYLADPEEFPESHATESEWASEFASALGEYAAESFGRVAKYASRWETPSFTRHARAAFEIPAITLETPYACCGEIVMTCERYREVGSRVARAVAARLTAG